MSGTFQKSTTFTSISFNRSIFEWITWHESGPLFVHNTYVGSSKLGNVYFIGKPLGITMEVNIWHTYEVPVTAVIVFRRSNLIARCLWPPIEVKKKLHKCCPLKYKINLPFCRDLFIVATQIHSVRLFVDLH